jgi:IS5 family transposase
MPWQRLVRQIEPHYPKGDGPGRPPVGIERMLRIYCLQQWFNLSDPGVEEALYDSNAMRGFVGIDLGREPAPDETTVCKFRHLLERHGLAQKMFKTVNRYLAERGMQMRNGTIVDATIIQAPSSTKNKEGKRDPEMHQTKKGNQWYFGMKAHIGVDSRTRLIHSVATTPANVHDSQMLEELLHGDETRVWGDSAYIGQHERMLRKAPCAQDFTNRRGTRNNPLSEKEKGRNRTKSKVRARVEHPFHVIKQIFGFAKVRYRGLMKNTSRIFMLCALANLHRMRHRLLRLQPA